MSSTSLLQVTGSESQDGIISTPTRFLMECGEWNFTPSLSTFANEMNPFDYIGVQKAKENNSTSKQNSPPTPPTSKEYLPAKTINTDNDEKKSDTPLTPPQQKANQRRSQDTNRVGVSSNSSLNSESSATSGEQQKQSTKQPQPAPTTVTKTRAQRSQPHQFSFHSYQPSKPAQHTSMPASSNNSTLIIKQENGQPNTKSRRNKDKSGLSDISDFNMDRKRHSSDDGEEAVERRQRFLERNRVAASKCRQKKKAWITELEERSDKVIEDNKKLYSMVNQLKEEAMFLKNQLLAHGNCDCDVVKQYLKQSAQFPSGSNITAQPPTQEQQMLPPPLPAPKQKSKASYDDDYFAPAHSTPTPSLPPLRGTLPS
ncbi:hypothetical protein K450DRAFT_259053 [Umbelopsis ramanniana AG]|uniref:BZIP domain-containing protein n=1 Tax=Umbelopsis ramanniana AG TaxID=1314678 RepID=A0AAD5H9B4_UMBRA|nr:uncharacterized protein K450DRAFT_259053 [Umbelopsis ramanniana AG]KAI8576032.1 hypothetical protein K450DRAFT_259053 [Umbelopsis ramanniana AG]